MSGKRLQKLPIGIQSFEQLRTDNYLYVDKTEHVYNLATNGTAYFLSRPRRFGKSMLCSTFRALFEGKKHLFKGTWIASSDWEWKSYPIIYLSFTSIPRPTTEDFSENIKQRLKAIALQYGVTVVPEIKTPGGMLAWLIEQLAAIGPVVMIVDEYDKPMISNLQNIDMLNPMRDVLKEFYEPVKDCGEMMRFLFITGVGQFSKVSIFSALNHLNTLSDSPKAATICGYTQNELEHRFAEHFKASEEILGYDHDHMLAEIKNWYNGYSFIAPSTRSERVYNPFSVLNFFDKSKFKNYWFESGTPSFAIDYFKQNIFTVADFEQVRATETQLSAIVPEKLDLTTVLYQTGYLTIKNYEDRQYVLGFPNQEIAESCAEALAQFIAPQASNYFMDFSQQLTKLFTKSTLTEASLLAIMKKICAEIPSSIGPTNERGFQLVFWLILKMSGLNIEVERPTALGRLDTVILVGNRAYIFELKIRGTAKKAIDQIEERRYDEPYRNRGLAITKIGMLFDASDEVRTITELKIETE
jgi:hypothetical protein